MELTNLCPQILLIDDGELDNIIFRLVIKKLFSNADITTAANGSLALELLIEMHRKRPEALPDYIFLDLRMPVMDGWEFLREYERLKIDPLYRSKIYILSSSIDHRDLEKSSGNPHVQEYLSKPINMHKLKAILEVPKA